MWGILVSVDSRRMMVDSAARSVMLLFGLLSLLSSMKIPQESPDPRNPCLWAIQQDIKNEADITEDCERDAIESEYMWQSEVNAKSSEA